MAVITHTDDDTEQQTATPTKRGPGRPKKRNAIREPVHEPVHGQPTEEDFLASFEYEPYEPTDSLHIDPELRADIVRDYGYWVQGVAIACMGKPLTETVNARLKNGYRPLTLGVFGGKLDHKRGPNNDFIIGDIQYMARPLTIEEMARAHEHRKAKAQVKDHEHAHQTQGIEVPMPDGGRHPSALKHNRTRHSYDKYEKGEIPE